jgi:hypothetical protein
MSWGGRRPGSGRKPKPKQERLATGQIARVLSHPSVPPTTNPTSKIEEFDAPDSLTRDERLVWLKLAPHAFANRTLTKGTAWSFEMLCRNIVLERELGAGGTRGMADHRGMIQRVDAELLRFNLSPCGKALYEAEPEAPANPLSRFRKAK